MFNPNRFSEVNRSAKGGDVATSVCQPLARRWLSAAGCFFAPAAAADGFLLLSR
jgi:hypothetical protein